MGTLGGHSKLYISKTMNFIFSPNTPPSHLPKSCHTDQLGHVKNTTNSKHWCTKNFILLIWGTWRPFQPLHLKNHEFPFFHKTPHPGIYLSRATRTNLAIFKTHRTQKIGAPRILRYSFEDTWRPFQTLHLKNHEFHFFTKHPTKPSTSVVPHRPTWPCAKHTELKTLVHHEFYGTGLGHLEAIPTFTSQKSWISFFHKTPHQAIYLSRATQTNLAICKTHRTQNICAPTILWYSFGDICRTSQTSDLKNHEVQFFTKHSTKPST